MIGYHNGHYKPIDTFCITVDQGLLYGFGIFSTLKVIDTLPLFLGTHLNHIHHSLSTFGLNPHRVDYHRIILSLLKQNNLTDARIKILYTEGIAQTELMIVATKLLPPPKSVSLTLSPYIRGNNPRYKHKTTNQLDTFYQLDKIRKKGYDDFIFVDHQHQILECSFSNIYFIDPPYIYTPPQNLPLLNGVIRQKLLSLKMPHVIIKERSITVSEMIRFSGAFITNSIKGIIPISAINGIPYHTELVEEYKTHVKEIITI